MTEPGLYQLAFSETRSNRIRRHLLFWLVVWLYHLLRIGIMFPGFKSASAIYSFLELTLFWGVLMNVIVSYSVVYYLVPRYFLKRKFVSFGLGIVVLFFIIQTLGAFHSFLLLGKAAANAIGYQHGWEWLAVVRPGFIRLFGNPPLICGLLLSLKMIKNWHLAQARSEALARENASAELQLLKAQVHPHFLFNTLNNIYSFTLNKSAQAHDLMLRLNDLLGYMVHECNESMVPLQNELKLLTDYVTLEKARYGSRLDLDLVIGGSCGGKTIAPLLLIPFVENSFKHGASKMLINPFVRLSFQVSENTLHFELTNNQPAQGPQAGEIRGIGLQNVRKRLQLIYPDRHHLVIESRGDEFRVALDLELSEEAGLVHPAGPIQQPVSMMAHE